MSDQTQMQIQISGSQPQSPCDYTVIKITLLHFHPSHIRDVICGAGLHMPDLELEVREREKELPTFKVNHKEMEPNRAQVVRGGGWKTHKYE